MFEIINGVTGEVVAEIVERQTAFMWAARYAQKNDLGRVQVNDEQKCILIDKPVDG